MSILKSIHFHLTTSAASVPLTLLLSASASTWYASPIDARAFLRKRLRAGVVVHRIQEVAEGRRSLLYFEDRPPALALLHPVCFMLDQQGRPLDPGTLEPGQVLMAPLEWPLVYSLRQAKQLVQNILNATMVGTLIRLEPQPDGNYQQWCLDQSVAPDKIRGVIVGIEIEPSLQVWVKCPRFPPERVTDAYWRWADAAGLEGPESWTPELWSHLAVQQHDQEWFGVEQFLPEAMTMQSIRAWLEVHRPLPGNLVHDMPYPAHADPTVCKYYTFHQLEGPLHENPAGLLIPRNTTDYDLVDYVWSHLSEIVQMRQERHTFDLNINVKGHLGGQLFDYQREAIDKLKVAQSHPVSILKMGCGGGKTQIIWTMALHSMFNPQSRSPPVLVACDRNQILHQTAYKLGDVSRITGMPVEQLERLYENSELAFPVDSEMLEQMETVLEYLCECRDQEQAVQWADLQEYLAPGQGLYPLVMGRLATICVNTLRSRECFPWAFFRHFIGDEADRSIPALETRRVILAGIQQHVPITLISATGLEKLQETFDVTEPEAVVVIAWRRLFQNGRLKQPMIRFLLQYMVDDQGKRYFDYQMPKPEKQDPVHMTHFFKWAAQANLADRLACEDLPRHHQPIVQFIVPNNVHGQVNQVLAMARQEADSVCEGPDKPHVVEVFNQKHKRPLAEDEPLEIALDKKTWDRGKDKSQLNRQASARNPMSQSGSQQRDATASFIQQTMRTLRMPEKSVLDSMTPAQRRICSTGTIMLPGKYLREYCYLLNQFCLEVYGQSLEQVSTQEPHFLQIDQLSNQGDDDEVPVPVPLDAAVLHHPILMPEGYLATQNQVLAQVIPASLCLRVRYLDTVKTLSASEFHIDLTQSNRRGIVFQVAIPETNSIATGTLHNVSQSILHLAFQLPLDSPYLLAQVKRLHLEYEAQNGHFYPLSDLLHGTEDIIAGFQDLESHFLDRYHRQELYWPTGCLLTVKRRLDMPSSSAKRQKTGNDEDEDDDLETQPDHIPSPVSTEVDSLVMTDTESNSAERCLFDQVQEAMDSLLSAQDDEDLPLVQPEPKNQPDKEDENQPEEEDEVMSVASIESAMEEDDLPVVSKPPRQKVAKEKKRPQPAVDDEDAPLVPRPRRVTVKRRPRGWRVKPPSHLQYGGQIVLGAAADRNIQTGLVQAVMGAVVSENQPQDIDFVDQGGLAHFPGDVSLIHSQDFMTVERKTNEPVANRPLQARRLITSKTDCDVSQAELADRFIHFMRTRQGQCVKQKCVVAHLYHAIVEERQLDRKRFTLLGSFTGQVTVMWQDPQLAQILGQTLARRHTAGRDEYTLQCVDPQGRCVTCHQRAQFQCTHTRSGDHAHHPCLCHAEPGCCQCPQSCAPCGCHSQDIQNGIGLPCSQQPSVAQ